MLSAFSPSREKRKKPDKWIYLWFDFWTRIEGTRKPFRLLTVYFQLAVPLKASSSKLNRYIAERTLFPVQSLKELFSDPISTLNQLIKLPTRSENLVRHSSEIFSLFSFSLSLIGALFPWKSISISVASTINQIKKHRPQKKARISAHFWEICYCVLELTPRKKKLRIESTIQRLIEKILKVITDRYDICQNNQTCFFSPRSSRKRRRERRCCRHDRGCV